MNGGFSPTTGNLTQPLRICFNTTCRLLQHPTRMGIHPGQAAIAALTGGGLISSSKLEGLVRPLADAARTTDVPCPEYCAARLIYPAAPVLSGGSAQRIHHQRLPAARDGALSSGMIVSVGFRSSRPLT